MAASEHTFLSPTVECSVCYVALRSGAHLAVLGCGHIFHAACVSRWRTTRNTCPMCRESIVFLTPEAQAPPAPSEPQTFVRRRRARTLPFVDSDMLQARRRLGIDRAVPVGLPPSLAQRYFVASTAGMQRTVSASDAAAAAVEAASVREEQDIIRRDVSDVVNSVLRAPASYQTRWVMGSSTADNARERAAQDMLKSLLDIASSGRTMG